MDRCDIIITAYRLNAVQPAAKALQRILGLSPADAAALAKRFPCVVRANEESEEAERLCAALQEAGAYAELQVHESDDAEPVLVPVPAPVLAPVPTSQRLAPAPQLVAPARPEEAPSGYVIGDLSIGQSDPAAVAAPVARKSVAQPAAPVPVALPAAAPATAEAAVSGNVQMLDDGFGGEIENGAALELDFNATGKPLDQATASAMEVVQGPSGFDDEEQEAAALELDYGGSANRSGKVEVKKSEPKPPARPSTPKVAAPADKKAAEPPADAPAPGHKYAIHGAKAEGPKRGQINVRDKAGSGRGFFGSLFSGSAAQLWTSACLIAVMGGAAYKVYALNEEDAVIRAQALRRMQFEANDNQVDHPAKAASDTQPPALEAPVAGVLAAKPGMAKAGIPVTVAAAGTEALEWSVAAERRARMHGIHKVDVAWPAEAKRNDKTECMLLDTKYASRLDELASTGMRVEMPPAVEKQLKTEADALQASKRYRDRSFVPICLANR